MSTRGGTKADLLKVIERLKEENANLRKDIERLRPPMRAPVDPPQVPNWPQPVG